MKPHTKKVFTSFITLEKMQSSPQNDCTKRGSIWGFESALILQTQVLLNPGGSFVVGAELTELLGGKLAE